ncbi:MAG: MFS transporter [Candidatus Limnocylindrales bacterium]
MDGTSAGPSGTSAGPGGTSAGPGRLRRHARSALIDTSAPRHSRDFRLLWGGQMVSEFGRQVIIIAMPFEVYVRTHSTIAIGVLAAVELVSILGLSLPAGALADSLDRRRLLMITQGILMLSALLLVATAVVPDSPLLLVYAAAFVLSAATAIDRPARKAALYSIVPRQFMNSAVAVDQASNQLAGVAGPALGGLIIGTLGLGAAFGLAAAGFGFMILCLFGLGTAISPSQAPMRRMQGIRAGLSFVRSRPAILSTMAMDFTAMVFGFPSALFPVLAISVFNVGAPGLGLIAAAPAIGALLASVLSGTVTAIRRKGLAVIVLFCLWGVAITLFGLASFSFPLALLFLGLAGAFDIAAAVLRASIVQNSTPDEMRGRVSSMNVLASASGPRLGDVEATMVASLTSVGFSIVSGGLLCIAGTLLVASRFPALRAYVEPRHPTVLSASKATA